MKITKFVHSCLLVEGNLETGEARNILIDPGQFSWESGLIDLNKLPQVNRILITHEHQDHFYLPFVQALKEKFPDAKIITNPNVVKILKDAHISSQTTS